LPFEQPEVAILTKRSYSQVGSFG